ncbi:GGDEF domain-containing protein, partial [Noviherbaspirillum denitrificans]|uniref:GGDEF domain-containing protein n=1 Tax=Noviherbaspirillum denitrificans TaxID=1968433 RepID=UPI001981D09B
MLGFDPRSFIIISAALGTLCAIIFAVLQRNFPTEIKGLKEWTRAYFLMTASAFLFALRGNMPPALTSYLANILLVCGIMMMHAGTREFAGLLRQHRVIPLFLTVLSFGLAWPTFFEDDYRLRLLLITGTNATLFGLCALVVWRLAEKRFAEWLTCVLFLFTGAVSLVRFVAALLQSAGPDSLTDASALQHLYLGTFSFSLVALGVGFILMVNQRLRAMLEHAASHDDMTGARRRTAFLEMLERELKGAPRGRYTSLLMIDIDDFKEINDNFGHIA